MKLFDSDRLSNLLLDLYQQGHQSIALVPEFEELKGFATGPGQFDYSVEGGRERGEVVPMAKWCAEAPLYVEDEWQATPAQMAHVFFHIPDQGVFMVPSWVDEYWDTHSFPVSQEFASAILA